MDLSVPSESLIENSPNSIDSPDIDLLERCLAAVNKKHFKCQISANVIWEVPKGTVSVRENTDDLSLDQEQALCFNKALELVGLAKYETAMELFRPLADAGHRDSQLAMCHLLKRTQGDWKKYAAMHNNSVRSVKAVPAACYYPEQQTIAIHPHLFQRNVPQFVLRYLIYHECCHQLIGCDDNEPHNEAFMVLELKAPHRERAINWLEKEGFPTIRGL